MNMMLLPYRRYADFNGRSRRSEYWMFMLLQVIVLMAFIVLLIAGGGAMVLAGGDSSQLAAAGGFFIALMIGFVLYWLASLIPLYAVAVRRLHDTNRSGWWVFGPLLLGILTNGLTAAAAGAGGGGELGAAVLLTGVITLVNFVVNVIVLVFLCLDGTPGPNQYGHDPKFRGYEHTFA